MSFLMQQVPSTDKLRVREGEGGRGGGGEGVRGEVGGGRGEGGAGNQMVETSYEFYYRMLLALTLHDHNDIMKSNGGNQL